VGTFSRSKSLSAAEIECLPVIDRAGGLGQTLTQLSDDAVELLGGVSVPDLAAHHPDRHQ
jgi:hypothetical protein